MKLPAVAMAAAFAGGLLLGGLPLLHCLARPSLLIAFVGVTLLLLILGRVVLGWLGHSTFTACFGAALGLVRERRSQTSLATCSTLARTSTRRRSNSSRSICPA